MGHIGTTKVGLGQERVQMAYYKQQKRSPWINTFAVAERWVNEQEN